MSFKDCWERTRKATGMKTQSELAAFLKIQNGPVSDAKKRNAFPLDWAFKISQAYGLSIDWIVTGKGQMRRGGGRQPASEAVEEELTELRRKEKISVLQKKINHVMENGNYGQIKALIHAIEDLYDEILLNGE